MGARTILLAHRRLGALVGAGTGPLAVAGHEHGDQVRDVALRQPERLDLGQLPVGRFRRYQQAQIVERGVDTGWWEEIKGGGFLEVGYGSDCRQQVQVPEGRICISKTNTDTCLSKVSSAA